MAQPAASPPNDTNGHDTNGHGFDRGVVHEAAQWLMLMRAENVTAADRQACARWRAAHPEHERVWQRAEQVNRTFGRVPAGVGLSTLDRAVRSDRRATLKVLALLIVAGPTGWAAWRAAPLQEWTADYRTATGERRDVILADGSRVTLNTASAIDVVYTGSQRLIKLLAGEVLISTAPDSAASQGAARPFRVQTAEGQLRALGTRFTVRQSSGVSHLGVLEGAVEIRPIAATVAVQVLPAGHQVRFTAAAIAAAEPITPQADAWSRGVLFADKMRLGEFATELGRYRPGLLRCDPAVAELRISGAFQLADTDRILAALPATLPVAVAYRTRYWVTLTTPDTQRL